MMELWPYCHEPPTRSSSLCRCWPQLQWPKQVLATERGQVCEFVASSRKPSHRQKSSSSSTRERWRAAARRARSWFALWKVMTAFCLISRMFGKSAWSPKDSGPGSSMTPSSEGTLPKAKVAGVAPLAELSLLRWCAVTSKAFLKLQSGISALKVSSTLRLTAWLRSTMPNRWCAPLVFLLSIVLPLSSRWGNFGFLFLGPQIFRVVLLSTRSSSSMDGEWVPSWCHDWIPTQRRFHFDVDQRRPVSEPLGSRSSWPMWTRTVQLPFQHPHPWSHSRSHSDWTHPAWWRQLVSPCPTQCRTCQWPLCGWSVGLCEASLLVELLQCIVGTCSVWHASGHLHVFVRHVPGFGSQRPVWPRWDAQVADAKAPLSWGLQVLRSSPALCSAPDTASPCWSVPQAPVSWAQLVLVASRSRP